MTNNWFGQSIFAMLCLIPAWLAIGFFEKNYQIKSDVFLFWYMLGIIIAILISRGSSIGTIFPSLSSVVGMLLIGLTIGAMANILLFRAVASAPNPGLPVAVSNAASIGVFFAAALLVRWVPKYFNAVKLDGLALLGVILTVVGVSLIAARR